MELRKTNLFNNIYFSSLKVIKIIINYKLQIFINFMLIKQK